MSCLTEAEQRQSGAKRVIVYVWTSEFLTNGGMGKAGHVAVEITRNNEPGSQTNNTYISFWPKIDLHPNEWPANRARPIFITDNRRWSFIENYTGDRLLEYRKPEYIFSFYTLKTSDIVDMFNFFKVNEDKTWNMFGGYFPRTADVRANFGEVLETKQSCVSLACLTLDAGGINKLLNRRDVLIASGKQQSLVSQHNSAEMRRTFNIIQPSNNVSQMIVRGLVAISGYIISPDVLVGRLKEAKIKEWKNSQLARNMGRLVCTTKISENGSKRTITFTSQDPNSKPKTCPVGPRQLQFENTDVNGNILDEKTYEWLPMDEDLDRLYALCVLFLVGTLCSLFLYFCYCKLSGRL